MSVGPQETLIRKFGPQAANKQVRIKMRAQKWSSSKNRLPDYARLILNKRAPTETSFKHHLNTCHDKNFGIPGNLTVKSPHHLDTTDKAGGIDILRNRTDKAIRGTNLSGHVHMESHMLGRIQGAKDLGEVVFIRHESRWQHWTDSHAAKTNVSAFHFTNKWAHTRKGDNFLSNTHPQNLCVQHRMTKTAMG